MSHIPHETSEFPKQTNTLNSLLPLLLLLNLQQQRPVDMRQHTTKRNRRPDQAVQFLVAADGELQVTRGDALDFQVFCGVAGEFEDFCGQIFEDGGDVDGGFGAHAHFGLGVGF